MKVWIVMRNVRGNDGEEDSMVLDAVFSTKEKAEAHIKPGSPAWHRGFDVEEMEVL